LQQRKKHQELLHSPVGRCLCDPWSIETLNVQQRRVEIGGVPSSGVVHQGEEVVAVPRIHAEVTGERVTLQRSVDAPVTVRREGHTLTIPVVEEVVIKQRLLVQEELWLTTRWIEAIKLSR
jgi:stress response protein YsnF